MTCSRCGSGEVIPKASLRDHTGLALDTELRVEVAPGGLLTWPVRADLHARICGRCGYAELFVERPAELYTAFRAAQKA